MADRRVPARSPGRPAAQPTRRIASGRPRFARSGGSRRARAPGPSPPPSPASRSIEITIPANQEVDREVLKNPADYLGLRFVDLRDDPRVLGVGGVRFLARAVARSPTTSPPALTCTSRLRRRRGRPVHAAVRERGAHDGRGPGRDAGKMGRENRFRRSRLSRGNATVGRDDRGTAAAALRRG